MPPDIYGQVGPDFYNIYFNGSPIDGYKLGQTGPHDGAFVICCNQSLSPFPELLRH